MRLLALAMTGAILAGCAQAAPTAPTPGRGFEVQFAQKAGGSVTPTGHEYLTIDSGKTASDVTGAETIAQGSSPSQATPAAFFGNTDPSHSYGWDPATSPGRKKGIIRFDIRWDDATGHFDLWDGSKTTTDSDDDTEPN